MIDLLTAINEHWRWKVKHEVIQDLKDGSDFRYSTFLMSAHASTRMDTPLYYNKRENMLLKKHDRSGFTALHDK